MVSFGEKDMQILWKPSFPVVDCKSIYKYISTLNDIYLMVQLKMK